MIEKFGGWLQLEAMAEHLTSEWPGPLRHTRVLPRAPHHTSRKSNRTHCFFGGTGPIAGDKCSKESLVP